MQYHLKLLLLLIFQFGIGSMAYALTPDSIKDTTKVDAESFFELANKRPDLIIIDARIKEDREQGHIEGSISLPNIITNCKKLAEVIPTPDTHTLFYCNGVKCGRSVESIKIAKKCGYQKIYWFRGGFEEWQLKGYPSIID